MEHLNKYEKIAFIFIIFLSCIISISLIGQHRFHGDEAWYSSLSMNMSRHLIFVSKPYLLYKPPIYFFLIEIFYSLFPSKEVFAVIPNILAFVFSIHILFLILNKMYNNFYIGLLGSLLFALSPINLLFSATAFIEPVLVSFILLSIYFLLIKKYFLFGIFLGLAFGTKQFVIFYLFFYFLIFLIDNTNNKKARIYEIILGFLIIYIPIILWGILNSLKINQDFLYAIKGWWGITDRTDAFIFNFHTFTNRVKEWVYYFNLIYFEKIIYVPLYIIIILNLIIFRKKYDILITLTLIIIFFILSLSQMPIYDRYIITFTPFIIMLSASSLINIFKINTEKKLYVIGFIILILFLVLPIRQGIFKYKIRNTGGETIGAMYSRNDGIDLLANYLLGKYKTPISICMHRDFSWVFDYYLYRAPEGYSWFPYEDYNIENIIKSFKNDLKNTNRKIFLLFYADNDEVEKFNPVLSQYGMKSEIEYEVYNRFNQKNMVLYRVVLK